MPAATLPLAQHQRRPHRRNRRRSTTSKIPPSPSKRPERGKFDGAGFKGGWRLAGLHFGNPTKQFTGQRIIFLRPLSGGVLTRRLFTGRCNTSGA